MHQPLEEFHAEPWEHCSLPGVGQQQPAELMVLLHHHRHPHQSRPDCLTSSFGSLKQKDDAHAGFQLY